MTSHQKLRSSYRRLKFSQYQTARKKIEVIPVQQSNETIDPSLFVRTIHHYFIGSAFCTHDDEYPFTAATTTTTI